MAVLCFCIFFINLKATFMQSLKETGQNMKKTSQFYSLVFQILVKTLYFCLFFASILASMADLQIQGKIALTYVKIKKNELITPLPPWRSKCKAREGALGSLLHVWPNESTFYRKIAAF